MAGASISFSFEIYFLQPRMFLHRVIFFFLLRLPIPKMGFAPCYENKTRSKKLNLDNKCFQQL